MSLLESDAPASGLGSLLTTLFSTMAPKLTMSTRAFMRVAVHLTAKRPDTLYHYTTAAGFQGILEKRAMWATHIRYLNDAKEFSFAVEAALKYLGRRARKGSPAGRKIVRTVRDCIKNLDPHNIYIISFSENADRLGQWRGYSPSGTGYALGFATSWLNTVRKAPFPLVRCIYDEKQQDNLIEGIIDGILDTAERSHALEQALEDAPAVAKNILTVVGPIFKHQAFEDEAEWRVIVRPSTEKPEPVLFRQGRSTLVPYLSIPLTKESEEGIGLTEVLVGPGPLPDLAREAVRHMLGVHGVNVQQIGVSANPYRHW